MEWFFGALVLIPVILISFVIMRVDLVLHYLRKESRQEPPEPPVAKDQPPT